MWQQLDSTSQAIFLNLLGLFEECILHTNPDQHYYFEKQDGDIYFSSQIPFPLMNSMVSYTANPQEIDTKCDALLNRFKTSSCPITWYWPHAVDMPKEVAAVFDKHGFQSMGNYLSIAVESHCTNHDLQQESMTYANGCSVSDHDSKQYFTNTAIKLANTFCTQAQLLAKLQGVGGQKIVVERVDVSHGGQAVIGNINS